jgi:hypothetical protein
MKILVASLFALSLLGATAASADGIGAGVHIGPVGVGVHAGARHRHCGGWDHHHRCRHWL